MEKKKTIMVIGLVLLLFVMIIGISYAMYTFAGTGTKENVITVGKLSVSYAENTNIELTNKYSETDSVGIATATEKSTLEFSVTSDTVGNENINYAVGIDVVQEGATLTEDYVKIYMLKEGAVATGFTNGVGQTIGSFENRIIEDQMDSHVVLTDTISGTDSHNYTVKAWVSDEYDLPTTNTSTGNTHSNATTSETFKFKIKVTATTDELLVVDNNKPKAGTLAYAIRGVNDSNIVTTGNGLYSSTETTNGSPTYYYHGTVENNYVSFANLTWRIVRINEDGTIKLVLNNVSDYSIYPYNADNYKSYEYMYYSNSNTENGIMKRVEDWYAETLKENYDGYISETNFCEAAKVTYDSEYVQLAGNATMEIATADYKGDFTCEEDGNGYQYVRSKVGLLTAEEVMSAGIPLHHQNLLTSEYVTKTYLQSNEKWWTMSPMGISLYQSVNIWLVHPTGRITHDTALSGRGIIRPVISLEADTDIKGTGTYDNMYEVILN